MKPQTWSNYDKIEHLVAWERLKNDKISFLNVIVNRSHNLFLGGGRWFELILTEILKFYFHLSFLGELNPNGALCTPKAWKRKEKELLLKATPSGFEV
jgi:hypothetical protein